jgi:exonuclease VII large subunit
MAKRKQSDTTDVTQPMQMMAQFSPAAALMAPQAEAVWETQRKLMEEWQRYTKSWFDRRRAAAESARHALHQLNDSGGTDGAKIEQAMKELSDWMSNEVERLSADATENVEFGVRCAHIVTEGVTTAGTELAEETREGAEAARTRAKNTPV